MKSLFKKVWDSPYVEYRGLKYKDSVLRIIFDRNTETNKRPIYSLGRIKLGSNSLIKSYQQPSYIVSNKLSDDSFGVISQGVINEDETENCSAAGLVCSDDDVAATNTSCPKNKCIVGKITYDEDLGLWRYESSNKFATASSYKITEPPPQLSLIYYTQEKLKNNPSRYYSKDDLIINKPATRSYKIIPSYSLGKRNDIRISIATAAYIKICAYREACIEARLREETDNNLRLAILSHVYSLGEGWREFISIQIEEYLYDEVESFITLSKYLDTLEQYQYSILLEEPQRYSGSKILDVEEDYANPIYSRLPDNYKNFDENIIVLQDLKNRLLQPNSLEIGTVVANPSYTKSYKYLPRQIKDPEEILKYGGDPLTEEAFYSPADSKSWIEYSSQLNPPVEKWLTSGSDKILSNSKTTADQFYHRILDPNTCDPLALDWISQFLGFTGEVWDTAWDVEIKRAVLLNAFGWFEPNLYDEITGYKTIKGEVCSKFPFNIPNSNWTEDEDNFDVIKLQDVSPVEYLTYDSLKCLFKTKTNLKINKTKWLGLHQTKGSLVNLIWWLNLLQVNTSNISEEIVNISEQEIKTINPISFKIDSNNKIPTPRVNINKPPTKINNNLDSSKIKEISNPITLSPAQTGDKIDAVFLENPLLAGESPLYDSNTVIVPLSFKYSRFNQIWEQLSYVVRNWTPVYADVKVQYQYAAADYVAADDYFFETLDLNPPSEPELLLRSFIHNNNFDQYNSSVVRFEISSTDVCYKTITVSRLSGAAQLNVHYRIIEDEGLEVITNSEGELETIKFIISGERGYFDLRFEPIVDYNQEDTYDIVFKINELESTTIPNDTFTVFIGESQDSLVSSDLYLEGSTVPAEPTDSTEIDPLDSVDAETCILVEGSPLYTSDSIEICNNIFIEGSDTP